MPNINKTDAVKNPIGAKVYGHDAAGNVGQFDAKDLTVNNFRKKSIVWLGTSVPNEPPFGEAGTKKYPEFVADILDATVTERAYGGSIVIYDPANSRYGLSGSLAEFAAESKVETSSEVSYTTALDGQWGSDLFVFDHGHNDTTLFDSFFTNGVLDAIDGTNQFDRTWFPGAMNYVIREIYKRNIRAKIVIINDYRAEYFKSKDALEAVADWWGIPIFTPKFGVKNIDITLDADTTYTTYDGQTETLLAGAVVNPLKFFTKASLDDTTPSPTDVIHPGRFGRIMYAKAIADFIKSNVFSADTTGFY